MQHMGQGAGWALAERANPGNRNGTRPIGVAAGVAPRARACPMRDRAKIKCGVPLRCATEVRERDERTVVNHVFDHVII